MKIHKRKKLGVAFAGEVFKVTQPFGHFKKRKLKDEGWEDLLLPEYKQEEVFGTLSPWRSLFLGVIFLLAFFGLFLRLFHLQIILGPEFRLRADANRIAIRIIHAPRGVIYDRNGQVLAESNPGFRLDKKIISRDTALSLEAKGDPIFDKLEIDTIRFYPKGSAFSHILGYVGQISEDELKDPKYSEYRTGDRIGRAGIEQTYESVLRGKDGAEIIEIDASGKKLRTLREIKPVPGQNIYLSIDADLQKVAFEALFKGVETAKSCCGVVVSVDPKSGEVLSLASIPSYDGNDFTDPEKNEKVRGYFENANSPLLNRVISGEYPPGSTFKIATSLAGLSSGKINRNMQVEDTGEMYLGPYKFSNWYFNQYGRKEGMVDLVKALQRSNDIYFYKAGELIGEKIIGETAQKIGFGKKLGIDLPGETSGLIPDNDWKEKNVGQVWFPGDTLHMSIGQGFILSTPLQVLAETSFVANEGKLMMPHLATKITGPDNQLVKEFKYSPVAQNIIKKNDLALVNEGLSKVPKDGGTAWPFFNFSIPTSGKTGTAEYGDSAGRTHAWYTSFAPSDDPRIVLTVLVEGGGEGSSVASPIAKEIYTWYFNPDKNNLKNLDNGMASDSAKMLGE